MSKKHRKRHNAISAVSPPIANHRLFVPPKPTAFSAVEDRRRFHPEKATQPARTTSGHPVKPHKPKLAVTAVKRGPDGRPMKKKITLRSIPSRLQFAAPKRTIICLKRKIRKEVLHALQRTGRGHGSRRRPKRNAYSQISC